MDSEALPKSNRHIVDRLAEVRNAIKSLKETEDLLKSEVAEAMGKKDSLGGDEYIARQTITSRKNGLDEARMIADKINIEKYRKPESTVYTIKCEKRERDE